MDENLHHSPVEILYQGDNAQENAQLYHQELEKFLKQPITLPSPISKGEAALGINEIIIAITLASLGKALVLSLLEFIENKISENNESEEVVELRFQLIIKKNPSDSGKRYPFQLKKIKNNVLATIFSKIRNEILKL